MEERVKHRIVGLAVIISIGVIFAPAVIRKSNQRMVEKTKTSNFHLPTRPVHPKVSVKDEEEVFKSVKVAHVSLDKPASHPVKTIAKAQVLSQPIAKEVKLTDSRIAVNSTSAAVKPAPVKKHESLKPAKRYAVQLASFSRKSNANTLVSKLNKQ
jgi:DedD protein